LEVPPGEIAVVDLIERRKASQATLDETPFFRGWPRSAA